MLVAVGRGPLVEGSASKLPGSSSTSARASLPTSTAARRVPHIYAVGDCAGYWQLAHTAFREGEVAAENALGHEAIVDNRAVPRPIYTDPEIAGVGLTEAQAREQYGDDVAVGVFPWVANARAVMQAETVGWVKSIHETRYGELLGMVMVGPHVTDLIEAGTVAIDAESTVETVADGMAAHPTLVGGDQGSRPRRARPRDPPAEPEAQPRQGLSRPTAFAAGRPAGRLGRVSVFNRRNAASAGSPGWWGSASSSGRRRTPSRRSTPDRNGRTRARSRCSRRHGRPRQLLAQAFRRRGESRALVECRRHGTASGLRRSRAGGRPRHDGRAGVPHHGRPAARRGTACTPDGDGEAGGWRAPGVPVAVAGFAGPSARVLLRSDGRVVATTTAGRLGRYRLHFAPRDAGTYRLRVQSAGRFRPAGSLRVRPVVLDAVGDITFGEQVGPAIAAHGGAYPWTFVAPTLRKADVTVGNLETAVSNRGVAAVKTYTFRGPPEALDPIHRVAGFDVLTLANNHTVDYGREALLDTVRAVHAAGMQTIGAGANDRQARGPAIVEAGGLKVALLGYSDVNPLGFNATSTEPGTAKADVAAITADVHAALKRADVAVCFFHWGVELHAEPNARQQQFAAACINAGAQLVIGAHPHVLGGLAHPTPHSLVAWTLGNFVFPSGGTTGRTAILHVTLGADGVRGARLVPVRIEGFRPRLG